MRGKKAKIREIEPDLKYNSTLVAKLINYVMKDGKKSIARTIVYKALDEVKDKTKADEIEVLEKAVANLKPQVEVRSRRVGGSNYQVPVPVPPHRQISLALRWLVQASRESRGSLEFWQVLAREIISAYNNEGNAIKKKEDVIRMAEANKAFAQFA
ncbi:MAG: 30S ribosomal protein S7 [Candidatus Dojkabacteria bacterium]|nr:MAG: 30S ribosomal protein S7 [Candidatus Dojkabacteria bacterium]